MSLKEEKEKDVPCVGSIVAFVVFLLICLFVPCSLSSSRLLASGQPEFGMQIICLNHEMMFAADFVADWIFHFRLVDFISLMWWDAHVVSDTR